MIGNVFRHPFDYHCVIRVRQSKPTQLHMNYIKITYKRSLLLVSGALQAWHVRIEPKRTAGDVNSKEAPREMQNCCSFQLGSMCIKFSRLSYGVAETFDNNLSVLSVDVGWLPVPPFVLLLYQNIARPLHAVHVCKLCLACVYVCANCPALRSVN
ncbi:hypothetical protein BU24DRAFT_189063 [Aaosphaeria arxii CBS 175.79]|uniref:Uncharacterized protein n=1 Tax=Aaosphaeria arxii CBS 175.79 TaxID=1450172 RepID=A0A6A5XS21_9PLEO|nr:uncharacterized protein BU24DRAFT_189063 [Aaosphaeria arxii CBS 175.79]KAF2015962.1 hypothetical protein BU24DRAFT_189063 [Aaosphaeria arxii CBS 175.79]